MTTPAHALGFTAGELIKALATLPADTPVLIDTAGDASDLSMVVRAELDWHLPDQYDVEGETVILAQGVYPVLQANELPYLVENETDELVADLADL